MVISLPLKRALWLLLLAGFLSACASGPGQQPAPVTDTDTRPGESSARGNADASEDNRGWQLEDDGASEDQEANVYQPTSSGAVTALLRRAENDYQRGDYAHAIATAERALRIDRRNASLYLILAQSYWQEAQPRQAESFARHGLRYSRDPLISEALQRVLQQAGGGGR